MLRRKLNPVLGHAVLGLSAVALCAYGARAFDELPKPRQSATPESPQVTVKVGTTKSFRCEPAKGGFLLLGKTPILPPYEIEYDGSFCKVDGLPIDLALVVYPGRRTRQRDKDERSATTRLAQQLARGRSLVQFSDRSSILLDRETDAYYLLKVILANSSGDNPEDLNLAPLLFFRPEEAWKAWLKDFEPTSEFLDRAKTEIASIDEVEAANLEANKAARRQGRPTFLLLVSGMVTSVLAIGHLLSHHPARESAAATSDAMRSFSISLILIVALAGFDVGWTVLWSPSGDVIELNPLGSHLIPDARQLVAFKCLATLITVAILAVLRHHRIARLAAWWSCLVLALVAMRWLTINSVFTS